MEALFESAHHLMESGGQALQVQPGLSQVLFSDRPSQEIPVHHSPAIIAYTRWVSICAQATPLSSAGVPSESSVEDSG